MTGLNKTAGIADCLSYMASALLSCDQRTSIQKFQEARKLYLQLGMKIKAAECLNGEVAAKIKYDEPLGELYLLFFRTREEFSQVGDFSDNSLIAQNIHRTRIPTTMGQTTLGNPVIRSWQTYEFIKEVSKKGITFPVLSQEQIVKLIEDVNEAIGRSMTLRTPPLPCQAAQFIDMIIAGNGIRVRELREAGNETEADAIDVITDHYRQIRSHAKSPPVEEDLQTQIQMAELD